MKAYKIDLSGFTGKVREVVSEAVQKKAFALGYHWASDCRTPIAITEPFLIFGLGGYIGYTQLCHFDGMTEQLITADDFLALTTAKDEPRFKPFDRVLRRDGDDDMWNADLFSHPGDPAYPYYCTASCFRQCIPYEGNEALLGTTDSPE